MAAWSTPAVTCWMLTGDSSAHGRGSSQAGRSGVRPPQSARLKRRELWLRLAFFTSGSCCHCSGSRNGRFGAGRPEGDVSSRIHIGLKTNAKENKATCGSLTCYWMRLLNRSCIHVCHV